MDQENLLSPIECSSILQCLQDLKNGEFSPAPHSLHQELMDEDQHLSEIDTVVEKEELEFGPSPSYKVIPWYFTF